MNLPNQHASDAEENKKLRRAEKRDDAVVFAEIISDEIPVYGTAKRIFSVVKRSLGKEYIQRIEYLEQRHEEVMRTQALLTRAGESYVAELARLRTELAQRDAELAKLKAKLGRKA